MKYFKINLDFFCRIFLGLLFFSTYCRIYPQFLNAPPDGNNQRVVITQGVGLASVKIDYHSPDVNGREGEIWGHLVQYNEIWRVGANENTTITFSHQALVENRIIDAGTYGLFIIPTEEEFTFIFSKDISSWGSFSYEAGNDALRISVKPEKSSYKEWLTFDFDERLPDKTVSTLKWENLKVSFEISFDVHQIAIKSFENQLKGRIGLFYYEGPFQAGKYCLENDIYLEKGLDWANESIIINSNFENNLLKARILEKIGNVNESNAAEDLAVSLGTPQELYYYGRELISINEHSKALKILRFNFDKYGGEVWPTHFGLGRWYDAMGDKKKALFHYKEALKTTRTERQTKSLNELINSLSKKKQD